MDTPVISEDIRTEQNVWNTPDTLTYYQTHRGSQAELYPSERFFLPDVLPRVRSVLDVGCAAGGFLKIMQSYNPDLRYTGMDITPELIAIARKKHAEGTFLVGDGVHMPFARDSFDLVHSSGVLHLNSRYPDMIKSMWDQAREYLLFDLRLTRGDSFKGVMIRPSLPYHVLNTDQLLSFLKNLTPEPAVIRANGYPHEAASSARLPHNEVIMACFLIEKRPHSKLTMEINFNVA